MTLYQLAEDYTRALEEIQIDETTGEVLGMDAVESIEDSFEHKAINCALYLKGLKAEADAISTEKKALAEREAATKKKLERIKAYVESCMVATGKDKIQDPRVKLSFRKSSRVQILDQMALPAKYLKIKTEPAKTEIANAIKSGTEVPGAELVSCRSLQIR